MSYKSLVKATIDHQNQFLTLKNPVTRKLKTHLKQGELTLFCKHPEIDFKKQKKNKRIKTTFF